MITPRRIATGIRFGENLKKKIEIVAEYKGKTINGTVNDACWEYVEEFEAKHGKIEIDKKHYGNT